MAANTAVCMYCGDITTISDYCDGNNALYVISPFLCIILLTELFIWVLCLYNKIYTTFAPVVVLSYNFAILFVAIKYPNSTTHVTMFVAILILLLVGNFCSVLYMIKTSCMEVIAQAEANANSNANTNTDTDSDNTDVEAMIPKWTLTKPTTIFNNDDDIDETDCDICISNKKNVIFVCGHYVYCNVCVEKIYENNQSCPLCKKHICPMYEVNEVNEVKNG